MLILKIWISLLFSVLTLTSGTNADLIMGTQYKGLASYYGKGFHGKRTANGEIMSKHALTCAHKTLPFGTMLEVVNPRNNSSVVLRVNDRGPYSGKRIIDVSEKAALELGMVHHGVIQVVATIVGKNGEVYINRSPPSSNLLKVDSFTPRVQTKEQEILLRQKRRERRKNEGRN